jgi:CysZ protein|tara:strand:- start:5251 stop:5946 length:696 start_codon:yes stop_codon:yes gene_type:complete
MILSSFLAALGQMGDPRFRRVLGLGIVLTIALLVGMTTAFVWLINSLAGGSAFVDILGEVRWLNDLISWGSFFLISFLSIFLMVPVASAITSMFLDEVAQAVEDKHYPQLPKVPPVPFGDALRDTINFLGVLIGANILALFLYAIFSFAAPFIFWALNGFLLGREYFMLAAMRRVGRDQAKILRKQHVGVIWVAGILMAMPLSIPLLNLFIPILGAATFTHLYHRISASQA